MSTWIGLVFVFFKFLSWDLRLLWFSPAFVFAIMELSDSCHLFAQSKLVSLIKLIETKLIII